MVLGSVVIVAKVIYCVTSLPKVLTDKSQVCAVELVLLEHFVSSRKTLRECLVQVILS